MAMLLLVMMFVESLWGKGSDKRFRMYGIGIIVFCILTYLLSGWWYTTYYGADKAIINAGDMAWAHSIIMEVKEHIFIPGIWFGMVIGMFAFFVTEKQLKDEKFRKAIALSSAFVILGILILEGFGSLIVAGLKAGFIGG